MSAHKTIMSHGLTDVTTDGRYVDIVHLGNMGETEADVALNVDHLLGIGMFHKLRPYGVYLKDKSGNIHSSPSYSYILRIKKTYFDSVVKL